MHKSSLNKVIIVGRVGNKPEGRYTPSGASTANFSVATNELWGEAESRKEHTEWHNIIAWNKTADFVTRYIQKGQLVSLEGRIRTRSWKDKDDNLRKTTEIVCDNITPLEWRDGEPEKSKSAPADHDENKEIIPF